MFPVVVFISFAIYKLMLRLIGLCKSTKFIMDIVSLSLDGIISMVELALYMCFRVSGYLGLGL